MCMVAARVYAQDVAARHRAVKGSHATRWYSCCCRHYCDCCLYWWRWWRPGAACTWENLSYTTLRICNTYLPPPPPPRVLPEMLVLSHGHTHVCIEGGGEGGGNGATQQSALHTARALRPMHFVGICFVNRERAAVKITCSLSVCSTPPLLLHHSGACWCIGEIGETCWRRGLWCSR